MMTARSWASDELKFINETLLLVEEMIKRTEHMMHDVHHVMAQLQKRFDAGEVIESVRSGGKPGEKKRTGLKLRRKESSKGTIPL